ncbi:metalloregulator ArsR/SmtB family transcription factor [Terasakiella sp. A23]|uniref:ArsR/SmtB family transcription factor n=1 Tax=Terasakiella sp. FCG-A23 TaxID=3080561 RepID=UPI0029542D63|nr:metalloregulator ArsR/SmtB family transcription factor [Terasakiella sp. A23]MDV7339739.1 metalloregulator ArsR/SmtB family transcription factor [Terasakiella sp. A23]
MENENQLDLIFAALADQRRRQIVEDVSEGARSVGEIAARLDLKVSAASKHIAQLEEAGIIYKTRQGRTIYCHINFDVWKIVAAHIARQASFWNNRLNELDAFLSKV